MHMIYIQSRHALLNQDGCMRTDRTIHNWWTRYRGTPGLMVVLLVDSDIILEPDGERLSGPWAVAVSPHRSNPNDYYIIHQLPIGSQQKQ